MSAYDEVRMVKMADNFLLRPFEFGDTNQVVSLWNTCLPFDPITQEKLEQFCRISHYDPAGVFVAEHNGEIIGFLPTIVYKDGRYNDTGWISSIVVHQDYEATELGHDLLKMGIEFLRDKYKTVVDVASFKEFRFFPHFDTRHRYPIALLEQHGFERVRELVDVSRSLTDFQTPRWAVEKEKQLRDEGIQFDYCNPTHHAAFLDFMAENFWETWIRKNRQAIEQNSDPKERILALKDGKVVGFIYFSITSSLGQISQTGVLPVLREKKIGGVLVYKAMAELKSRGATELFIAWCPWGFYRITEGKITRTRVQLRKVLSQ